MRRVRCITVIAPSGAANGTGVRGEAIRNAVISPLTPPCPFPLWLSRSSFLVRLPSKGNAPAIAHRVKASIVKLLETYSDPVEISPGQRNPSQGDQTTLLSPVRIGGQLRNTCLDLLARVFDVSAFEFDEDLLCNLRSVVRTSQSQRRPWVMAHPSTSIRSTCRFLGFKRYRVLVW